MNNSRSKVMLVVLVVSLILAGTAGVGFAQEIGGTLRVALDGEPVTLDWQFTGLDRTRTVAANIFECLVTLDASGEVIPQLADSWEISEDGLTYVFSLRKGVLFHNKNEMVAEDVKASFERFLEVGQRRLQFGAIDKIEIVDEYTVAFHLSKKEGAFLDVLATPSAPPCILPREAVEGKGPNEIDLIGTGPFMFVEWIPDQHVKLERFGNYKSDDRFEGAARLGGKREAYVETLLFIAVPEADARLSGILSGEYDFILNVPAIATGALKYDRNIVLDRVMPSGWSMVVINHANPPMDNLKVRRAIQIGLSMEPIMAISTDGVYRVDHNYIWPEQKWSTPAGKEYYNVDDSQQARELLAEAGYQGEEIVILLPTDYDWMYRGGLVMTEQLRKYLGMNVKIVAADYGTVHSIRKQLTGWHFAVTGNLTEPGQPPSGLLERIASPGWGHYSNSTMDALIASWSVPESFEERYAIWEDIQQYAYEDVRIIKWGDFGSYNAMRTSVQGYETFITPRFWNVWLEESE